MLVRRAILILALMPSLSLAASSKNCPIGYRKIGLQSSKCVPICRQKCGSGNCIKPNVCSCLRGYENLNKLSSNRCVPKCKGGCHNGRCAAPNKCFCAPKYKLNVTTGHCLPICDSGCPNGSCKIPGVCTCNEGFTLNPTTQTCHPQCKDGYKLDFTDNRCIPVCSKPCDNGFCSSPETCGCNENYQKGLDNKCAPISKEGCLNGICTSPGK
ncbi:epidermal growth factor-like protein [Drosophila albomicans]|uniref:Epidermal growth factor-like protein n=1 Tax=Drosophila albomicans TaxID=7291 RepID=A0A9C6T131_DROAB|nr:epidermal growth factor-like protein [Drosophila albomicans]